MESLNFEEQLQITDEAKSYLKESAKWGKFLAIVGFVMTGFLVLIALFVGTIFGSLAALNPNASALPFPSIFLTVVYLALAAIYVMPCLYLYRFSVKTKLALQNEDTNTLTEALMNHKSMFKFMGIMMAVVLGFYALIIVFVMIGGAFGALTR